MIGKTLGWLLLAPFYLAFWMLYEGVWLTVKVLDALLRSPLAKKLDPEVPSTSGVKESRHA